MIPSQFERFLIDQDIIYAVVLDEGEMLTYGDASRLEHTNAMLRYDLADLETVKRTAEAVGTCGCRRTSQGDISGLAANVNSDTFVALIYRRPDAFEERFPYGTKLLDELRRLWSEA
jgi:hypothetical protein